jgi:sugar phosphate permease
MQTGKLDLFFPDSRPTRVRWLIFVLIGAASWLLYLHRYAWGVVKPSFRAENPGLTATELGWLDSAFLATYAIGQVPGGLAGDVFGPRAVLGLSILLWSLTVAGLASANGFWPLFGVLLAFGLSQAGAYPAVSKVTRSWFPPVVRTSVQGVVTSLGRVGAACAPPILAVALMGRLGLSWREALVVIALPGVLLALAFWLVFRNSPREHPWANRAEQQAIEPDSLPAVSASAVSPPLRSGTGITTRTGVSEEVPGPSSTPTELVLSPLAPPLIPNVVSASLRKGGALLSPAMLLAHSFFSTFADMLYVFWIPSFLVEGKGLSAAEMGWFAPLPLLGGAVGGVLGGALNDVLIGWTGRPRWVRSGVAFSGKFLAAVLIVISLAVPDGRWVMVLLLACKFFGDWSMPTLWGTITDVAGKGAGTVFGVVNTVGSIGGFAAGPLLGYLKQHHGWDGLFLGVAVAYLASALTWLFIDCTRRLVVGP